MTAKRKTVKRKKPIKIPLPARKIVPPPAITRNRFSASGAAELTSEEILFGAAMNLYLAGRKDRNVTCGEILEVLFGKPDGEPPGLGYTPPPTGTFLTWVRSFAVALAAFVRKHHRPFPTWSEMLGITRALGWVSPRIETDGVLLLMANGTTPAP